MQRRDEVGTEIQLRGVPEQVKQEAKRRAAQEGLSLSGYVLRLIMMELAEPSRVDFAAWLRQQKPIDIGMSGAEAVAAARRGEEA
jgi:hypothetical protein